MIQANELRLGNLILDNYGEIVSIQELCTDVWLCNKYSGRAYVYECANGIPLTEEWLLKFGFEKYDEIYWFLPNYPSYEICPNEPLQLFLPCETTDKSEYYVVKDSNCKIQYVHQLQNLYFALTGKELTIKE